MTAHDKYLTRVVALIAIGGALISVVGSWSTAQAQLASTVTRSEHVADSIVTARRIDSVVQAQSYEFRVIKSQLDRIDARVSEMYCEGKPAGCR